jgi:hypothetical protein
MHTPGTQRGFLLIVAVVLIAVAAIMATVMVALIAVGGQAGGLHLGSTQAFHAAATGLEHALYQRNTAAWDCNTPASYTSTMGSGSAAAGYEVTCYRRNPTSTTLSAGITATATVIPLTNDPTVSPYIYAPFGQVKIDYENIFYTAIGSATECAAAGYTYCLIGAERGVANTLAAAHSSGRAVQQDLYVATSEGWNASLGRTTGPKRTLSTVLVPTNLLPTSSNANFNAPQTPCVYNPPSGCQPTGWKLDPVLPSTFQPWQDGGPDGSRAAYAEKPDQGPSEATNAGQFSFSPPLVVTAPTTLTLTFDYKMQTSSPQNMELTFILDEMSPGTGSWSSSTLSYGDSGGVFLSGSTTISITGSGTKQIDKLSFTMKLKGGQPKWGWLDNLFLAGSGGNPKHEPRAWREVFP